MTQLNIFTRTVAWCICFLVFLHLGYARKNELKQNPTVTPTTYSVLVGTQPLLTIGGTSFDTIGSEIDIELYYEGYTSGFNCNLVETTPSEIRCMPEQPLTVLGPLYAQLACCGSNLLINETIQIAVIRDRPTIVANLHKIPLHSSTSLILNGTGFSEKESDNVVVLSQSSEESINCSVIWSTSQQLECVPLSALSLGFVYATIKVDGIDMADDPVLVGDVDYFPVINSTHKSIAINAPFVDIFGWGFSPEPSQNNLVLSSGSCIVTNSTFEWLRCTFNEPKPDIGPLMLVSLQSHGVNVTFAPDGIQIATVRHPPVITNVVEEHTGSLLTRITITGFHFSPQLEENRVFLSSGFCNVISAEVVGVNSTLICDVSGSDFHAGELTARIVVQDGVSSLDTPIYNLVPYIEPTNNYIPITSTTITIYGLYFSTNPSEMVVEFDRVNSCNVTSSTATMLVCRLANQFYTVGPLHAVVRKITSDNQVLVSSPGLIGTILPVVFSNPNGIPVIPANDSTIRVFGYGYAESILHNKVTLYPGDVPCEVVALISEHVIECTFNSNLIHGGPLSAAVHVFVNGNYYSSLEPKEVALAQPIITPSYDEIPLTKGAVLSISGWGFSRNFEDVSFVFNPTGDCTLVNLTTTQIICTLSNHTLGPLMLQLRVRNMSTDNFVIVGVVSIPITNLPPHLQYLQRNDSDYDEPFAVEEILGYPGSLRGGTIAGLVVIAVVGLLLIGVVMFVFMQKFKQRFSAVRLSEIQYNDNGNMMKDTKPKAGTPKRLRKDTDNNTETEKRKNNSQNDDNHADEESDTSSENMFNLTDDEPDERELEYLAELERMRARSSSTDEQSAELNSTAPPTLIDTLEVRIEDAPQTPATPARKSRHVSFAEPFITTTNSTHIERTPNRSLSSSKHVSFSDTQEHPSEGLILQTAIGSAVVSAATEYSNSIIE